MKICIIFGHNNTKNSFNASIRDSFIDEAIKVGHQIDLINLFDENEQLPFYRSDINPPPKLVALPLITTDLILSIRKYCLILI